MLDTLARSYGGPPYKHMPSFSYAGWICNDGAPPLWVGVYENRAQRAEFAAVWTDGTRTLVAVIPTGQGDDRLRSMTTLEDLQAINATVVQTGIFPGGSLALAAPTVDAKKFDGFLEIAGLAVTEKNRFLVHRDLHFNFMVKAMQSPLAQHDPRAWGRFEVAHPFTGSGAGSAQAVLNDLIEWDPKIAPYVQDWQDRYQALMLDVVPTKKEPWADYDR